MRKRMKVKSEDPDYIGPDYPNESDSDVEGATLKRKLRSRKRPSRTDDAKDAKNPEKKAGDEEEEEEDQEEEDDEEEECDEEEEDEEDDEEVEWLWAQCEKCTPPTRSRAAESRAICTHSSYWSSGY